MHEAAAAQLWHVALAKRFHTWLTAPATAAVTAAWECSFPTSMGKVLVPCETLGTPGAAGKFKLSLCHSVAVLRFCKESDL